ncbi:hypothetical protein BDR03DRAFT_974677 [Suillus americanus]|nr:hypothetical protein BDR03DRAFT_974677 [Suillus americanus]
MQQKLQQAEETSKSGTQTWAGSKFYSNNKLTAWHGHQTERNSSATNAVWAISLSQNERLLASASDDKTARLWNLDTNLPVGPPLQHGNKVHCAALSPDGKVLVTVGCQNKNAYTWDIHAILKKAGLEDLLQPLSDVARGTHHRSPAHDPCSTRTPLLEQFSSFFHQFHGNTNNANKLQQRTRQFIFSCGPRIVQVPAVRDREVIFTAPPPPQNTQQQTRLHGRGSFTTLPAPGTNPTTPHPRYAHSLPVRLLAYLVLFISCASPQHANTNAQPTQQQQGQPQPQVQAQALAKVECKSQS